MKYLLKNGTIVSGSGILDQDVLIDGEKIVRVGEKMILRQGQGQPFWVEQLWSLIMPLRTRAAIR